MDAAAAWLLGRQTHPADIEIGSRVRALRLLVLAHLAAEAWVGFSSEKVPYATLQPAFAAGFTALFFVGLVQPRFTRRAALVAGLGLAAQIAWLFPFCANHTFLLLVTLALAAGLDPARPGEDTLAVNGLRWTACLVLFHSGLQKVLHGTYFRGAYLAYLVSLSERFRLAFGPILPAAEIGRLEGLGSPVAGVGPYLVDAPLFVGLSNLVYVLEMTLAVLLVVRRTRAAALPVAVTLIALIESAARELFFGVLYVNLLLLFTRRDRTTAALPWCIAIYAAIVLLRLVLAPDWFLT